ncbi:MAG TPA: tetratricopeptide repeat protein, partial [Pyrinomonadaceae bacterium]|nr:tetratricopeptide repeat protein [Pyrinomonadaceae bacterium]
MKKCVSLLFGITALLGTFVYILKASSYSYTERSLYNNIFQGRNSIIGFVFAGGRQPVSNVFVELLTDTYSTISRVKTSGAGFYSFPGLADGNYIIKILPSGTDYEEQTQTISLVSISVIAGRGAINEQVDFYLKVKKNVNSGPLAAPGVIFAQEIPKDAKKLYEEGVNYLRDKKEKEGFEKLKSSIEIFPQYYLALDRLGTEYVVRGYYRPAFVLLTQAVEINPRSFSSSFGLGLALFRLQQVDKAIENLRRATEIYNKSANAYLWLGIALHQNKNLPQTEAALIQANKLS